MKTKSERMLVMALYVAICVCALSLISLGVVFAQNTSGNGSNLPPIPSPSPEQQPFYTVVVGVIATLATASATISGVIAFFIKALRKDNTKLGRYIIDGNEYIQQAAIKIKNTKEVQNQMGQVLFAYMDGKLGNSAEIEQKLYSPKIKLVELDKATKDAEQFVVNASEKGKVLLSELGVIAQQ